MIKSGGMKWAVYVARRGEETFVEGFGGETRGKETIGETKT